MMIEGKKVDQRKLSIDKINKDTQWSASFWHEKNDENNSTCR
jgi:hypothetical protein